jgi:hypothetical protein
MAGVQKG